MQLTLWKLQCCLNIVAIYMMPCHMLHCVLLCYLLAQHAELEQSINSYVAVVSELEKQLEILTRYSSLTTW